MTYFAAALARADSNWSGAEVDLDGIEDLDGVVETLRSAAGDDAEVALLVFEENDEWFGVVRLDQDADPRVFVSDGRVVETSAMGGILAEAAAIAEDEDEAVEDSEDAEDDDEDDAAVGVAGEPIGDADLLSDLGTPARKLYALCAEEGQLPADILSAVCDAAGCLDTLDALRET